MGTGDVNMRILVILGPTSTGKTDLAILLAGKFNGEIVSCDSRQVYTGLDIGTGKFPISDFQFPTKKENKFWEIDGIKVWMYDVASPKIQYTVYDYVKDADKVISGILKRGKLPIIVGGTGLYLKALIEGLPNLAVPVDPTLRKHLETLSLKELQEKLQRGTTGRWQMMNQSDRKNPRRLIRAIELSSSYLIGRLSYPVKDRIRNDVFRIGLAAQREVLYKRVDESVVSRMDQGMIDEVKQLRKKGLTLKRMRQLGLEYGVLADYLSGKIKTLDEFIKVMQNKIHGYVRRQITWFKKEKGVFWFDITNKKYPENVEKRVSKWYHQTDDTKNRHFT